MVWLGVGSSFQTQTEGQRKRGNMHPAMITAICFMKSSGGLWADAGWVAWACNSTCITLDSHSVLPIHEGYTCVLTTWQVVAFTWTLMVLMSAWQRRWKLIEITWRGQRKLHDLLVVVKPQISWAASFSPCSFSFSSVFFFLSPLSLLSSSFLSPHLNFYSISLV